MIGGVMYYFSTETLDGIATGASAKLSVGLILEKVSQEGIKPEVTGFCGHLVVVDEELGH